MTIHDVATYTNEDHRPTGRTVRETIHGQPEHRITLPAGVPVRLRSADNLSPDVPIVWWASPIDRSFEACPDAVVLTSWASSPGLGLQAADVRLDRR